MKTKVILFLILSLLINTTSNIFASEDMDTSASLAFNNTISVAKGLFVSYCLSATLKIVLNNVAQQSSPGKKHPSKKSESHKAFTDIPCISIGDGCSWNLGLLKTPINLTEYLSTDIVTREVMLCFIVQSFQVMLCIIFALLFYLLPRGAIDNNGILYLTRNLFARFRCLNRVFFMFKGFLDLNFAGKYYV